MLSVLTIDKGPEHERRAHKAFATFKPSGNKDADCDEYWKRIYLSYMLDRPEFGEPLGWVSGLCLTIDGKFKTPRELAIKE